MGTCPQRQSWAWPDERRGGVGVASKVPMLGDLYVDATRREGFSSEVHDDDEAYIPLGLSAQVYSSPCPVPRATWPKAKFARSISVNRSVLRLVRYEEQARAACCPLSLAQHPVKRVISGKSVDPICSPAAAAAAGWSTKIDSGYFVS